MNVKKYNFFHILLLILLNFSMASCGGGGGSDTPATTSTSTSTSTTTTTTTTTSATTLPAIQSVAIDSSGNILVNGSGFFPIILYDAGISTYQFIQNQNTTLGIAQRYAAFKDHLQDIKNKGFNTVLSYPVFNNAFSILDFQTGAEVGLYVIPRTPTEVVNASSDFSQLRAQTQLLFWNTADEPDLYQNGIQTATQLYSTVKASDSRPIVIPVADVANYTSSMTAYLDVLFSGVYLNIQNSHPQPVDLSEMLSGYGEPPYSNFATVSGFFNTSWSALRARSGTSFIPIIGVCKTSQNPEPTAAQLRAMGFLAIVYDAKGLSYFALTSDDAAINTPTPTGRPFCYLPEGTIWDTAFTTAHADIKKIESFVYAGNYSGTVTNNNTKVHLKAKNVSGKLWVVAVNVLGTNQGSVTFTIDRAVTSVRELVASASVSASGTTFSDTFDSYAVKAYEISF